MPLLLITTAHGFARFLLALGLTDFAPPIIDWAFLWMAGIVFSDDPASIFVHYSRHLGNISFVLLLCIAVERRYEHGPTHALDGANDIGICDMTIACHR